MAKHIEAKRNRLKEYTRDIPNEDDVPAPWVARGYADDLAQTLQSIIGKSREDSIPKPPAEAEQNATPAKRWSITWLKGLAKEIYGQTVERITKAYLDKYG